MRLLSLLLLITLVFPLSGIRAQTPVNGAPSIGDPYTPDLGNTGYDVQHYDLDLKFDFEQMRIDGVATLDAVATLDNLIAFTLDFSNLTATQVLFNDTPTDFEQQPANQKLLVLLKNPLAKDEKFTLKITYGGEPKPFDSRYLRFLPIGLYMLEKTRQVFTVNQPDAAHSWFPCNDHPIDRATFDFHLTVPEDLSGVANGQPTRPPTENGNGTKTFHWGLPVAIPTYLTIVAAADYEKRDLPNEGTGIPLAVYAYKKDADAAAVVLRETGKMMKAFQTYFGPYPYPSYGQLLVNQSSVGLETASMTILPDRLPLATAESARSLVGHELAHQWFGDSIAVETWADIWLNEGFASYAEILTFEALNAPESARRSLNQWESAMSFARNTGTLVQPVDGDMFGIRTYLKGGFVLHMLRVEVGDATFFDILRTYVKRYTGKTARTADFEAVAIEVSKRDLKSFFDRWLRNSEIPTAQVFWRQTGTQVEMLVCQRTKTFFALNIPLVFASDKTRSAETRTQKFALTDQKSDRITVEVEVGFEVKELRFDPDQQVMASFLVSEVEELPSACGR
jgi:aminopeptidase N